MPVHESSGLFSYAWPGLKPGENYLDFMFKLKDAKNLHEVDANRRSYGKWKSYPLNILMADTQGNIAYMLMTSSPVRKNEYPYLGCRVLDGTTTDHDHIDIVDFKNLPFVMNPKKGYFV